MVALNDGCGYRSSMEINEKTTILFDFDGTLAETMMLIHEVFNRLAGVYGYSSGIVIVQFLALKGEGGKALSILRETVDAGWAYDWFWHINNRNLDSIRDEPEFQKIVAELEAKMVAQLAVIEALPDMGPLDLRHK